MTDVNPGAPEVLRDLQENLHHALASLRRVEGLREQLEASDELQPYVGTEEWLHAWQRQAETKASLESAIEEIDVVIAWFSRHTSSSTTEFWIDQVLMFRDDLQSKLANASQAATSFYEVLRPFVVDFYLENEDARPAWHETWPYDAELAMSTMVDLGGQLASRVDSVDIYIAKLRWDLDWSQQRMATILGFSQPSVAMRLARIEDWISQRVALKRIELQAAMEGFQLLERTEPATGVRGQSTRARLRREDLIVELEVAAITRDTPVRSTARNTGNPIVESVLRIASQQERLPLHDEVEGVAIYDRARGELEFYDMIDLARAVQAIPRTAPSRLLWRILEMVPPARTLSQLLSRGMRYRKDSGR